MQFEGYVVIGVDAEGACARPRWARGGIAHAQMATYWSHS